MTDKYSNKPQLAEDWRETGERLAASEITARDAFAMRAMQAYCSDPEWRLDMTNDATARSAYSMADAMLKARLTGG